MIFAGVIRIRHDGSEESIDAVQRQSSKCMATGSGQLCYHGKHRYLSTAELRAGHNYYKILFSHINYYLQFQCQAPIKKNSAESALVMASTEFSVYLICKFVSCLLLCFCLIVFYQHCPAFSQSQFMQLLQQLMQHKKKTLKREFMFIFLAVMVSVDCTTMKNGEANSGS